MKTRRIFAPVVACSIAILAYSSGAQSPAPVAGNEVETVEGQRLDPSLYGPGVIETWEEAQRRAREMPAVAVNPKLRNGQQGKWVVPKPAATSVTHSGVHNVVNLWGDTNMGIAFPGPEPVVVQGAWFAGQAARGAWTPGLRVHGFANGQLIASTDWFTQIGEEPQWFEMNLAGVDRIEIEAKPIINGSGWYSMDDFTYERNENGQAAQVVIDFEDCFWGQVLSGSDYAGMIWEIGTGDFDQGVPGPINRDDADKPPPASARGAGGDGGGGTDAVTPTLLFGFQGPVSGGGFPPDTCGAVGPSHFVTVVNFNFSVWRKSDGFRLLNQNLSTLFNGGSGDPRVYYDVHSSRWFAVDTDFSTRVFLAVSTSSDPTGAWFKTNFVAGSSLDFPTLGVDANGVYVGVWPTSGGTLSLYAINKAPLIAPSPSLGTVTAFTGLGNDMALQPALTYGTPAGEYVVSRQSSTLVRLRRVNPPLTAPTLTTLASIAVPSNGTPPDAPAQGSATALDTGDTRLVNAVYRDGFIWASHTINVGGRAACRWYKINPGNSTLADSGTISDPVRHYFYPSIAVNASGDVVMGFSGSSSSQFAGAYYSGRSSTDPSGQMGTPALLRAGNASYQVLDGFGRNRWGDYSLTTADPTDTTIWTIQEYAHATNTWGTHIGRLIVNMPPSNDNCENQISVVAGSHSFNTVFATTDGPDEPGVCSFNGSSQIQNDVWYKYLAQCTGTATISLCGASFDTKLAVYPSAVCPTGPGTAMACSDDFCGTSSQVTFNAVSGTVYRFRIGSRTGATGTGTVVITCSEATGACCMPDGSCNGGVTASSCASSGGTFQGANTTCGAVVCPQACPADVTGDGFVNVNDLLAVINAWGPCPGCAADITGDNQVNVNDLLAVINAWGPCP